MNNSFSTDEKRDLVLCMHPLLYWKADVALKTVEWMEMLRIMKYDKVVVPYFHLDDNMLKILRSVKKL